MAPRKKKRKVNKTEILLELQKIIESKKSPGRHISDADFKLLGIQHEIPHEDIKKSVPGDATDCTIGEWVSLLWPSIDFTVNRYLHENNLCSVIELEQDRKPMMQQKNSTAPGGEILTKTSLNKAKKKIKR